MHFAITYHIVHQHRTLFKYPFSYAIICHTPDIIIVAVAKNAKTKSILFRGKNGMERQHGDRGRVAADGSQLRGPIRRVVPERSRNADLRAQPDGEKGGG